MTLLNRLFGGHFPITLVARDHRRRDRASRSSLSLIFPRPPDDAGEPPVPLPPTAELVIDDKDEEGIVSGERRRP